ncbi:DNA-formamidopyrimidine glycosylase family protein, partial [Halomonas sp. BBD45]
MPELPEVETTRRGIAPHIVGQEISEVIVRERRLRTPVPDDLADSLIGRRIGELGRRAKYLLLPLQASEGGERTLIWHLGMSGSLRIARVGDLPRKHDHVDIIVEDG